MSSLSNKLDLSYRHIFAIAIPIVLANLAMPIQSSIDIAVVGHFNNTSSLAGLGLATQLLPLILVSLNFLQYASSGLAAQALGKVSTTAKDSHSSQIAARVHLQHILQRSLVLAIVLGIIMLLLRPLLITYGLELLAAQTENKVAATTYLDIRMLGVVFELMNFAFIGWFAGQGLSKLMLYQQGFIAVSNIFLTLLFVYGFDMGLAGVALGTVSAYIMGILLALNLAAHHLNISLITFFKFDSEIFNQQKMLRLFSLNKDIFIRTVLLTLCFAWITRLSALQGDVVLATNAVLLQVLSISAFALDGVAVAAESLSGQAASRGNRKLFMTALKRTGSVIFSLAGVLSVLWYLFMPLFITTMTDISIVIDTAEKYHIIASLLPLVGAGAYWLDGIMFGLTAGKLIRRSAIIMAAVFFPISYLSYVYLSDLDMAMWAIWLSIYLILLVRLIVNGLILWRNQHTLLRSALSFDN